jgi:hypothetical protein
MNRTSKADWLTNYLYRKNFWVGGTKVMHESNSKTTALQTFRYFQAGKMEFLLIYILEFLEPLDEVIDYESAIQIFSDQLLIKPNFTLAIWPNKTHKFAILEDEIFYQNLDSDGVLQKFEKYDSDLIGKSSNLKPINRSFNDFFHLWARQHMKGFQNDIDAFTMHEGNMHMLELKRPRESAKTWKPYRADTQNYLKFENFCSEFNFQLTNIAYTESEPGRLKIFKNVRFENEKLKYVTATLSIKPDDDLLVAIENLIFQNQESER